ncbi:transketolase [Paenibacillus montaniterrae]|uniref:Transketolase n=1 Tax=Paenibacillus montaniterrae TaxID=429341 RepID=A0A920CV27_9BACL|nr:transketolase [Paenibacillus montaniterrae]GIP17662.1 transketolase [Paenibacillus montaniterrae]
MNTSIEQLSVMSLRSLAIDMIEQAGSGHPGMPLGCAPMAYALWTRHMKHNPKNPAWFNRDRFVLSAGHGSSLLYSLLHLSGYPLSIEDLKQFRQWQSKTPGHPEYKHTPGIDATTGPLGQGIATAVGLALAEQHLAAVYNQPSMSIIDHFTYVICGDGDLMEGISYEAASLAGHLQLGKLIVLYDSNDISLDGELHMTFSEDVKLRFEAQGWQYIKVEDGNDISQILQALELAKSDSAKPTLIEVKTTIGFGSPNKAGKSASHGSPLGAEEAKLTKQALAWKHEEAFYIPEQVYAHFEEEVAQKGIRQEQAWQALWEQYALAYPELAKQLQTAIHNELELNWQEALPQYQYGSEAASRAVSEEIINRLSQQLPSLIGGSADLASSNKTMIKHSEPFLPQSYQGKNIWFGVREFAMGAMLNGLALHGGLKPYAGTFFVFSDYLRPAIRLAALMGLPVTYVFTHDSIAVGEDGPTHEPIEQLASLRAMPNLSIIRPADANETAAAWRIALESTSTPTALVLSRQNLSTMKDSHLLAYDGVSRGAYTVSKGNSDKPHALLLATGSEVQLALQVQQMLAKEQIDVAVVSMPSWDRFEQQPAEYKHTVLPPSIKKRVAIEMAASLGWERYVGDEGDIIAIDKFGASAPGDTIIEQYGFSVVQVAARVKKLLELQ